VLWLQTAARAARGRARRRAAWSDPPCAPPPGDLHSLSAPH